MPVDRVVDIHAHTLPRMFSELADTGAGRYGMEFDRRATDHRLVFKIGDRWLPLLQGSVYDETPAQRVARMDANRVDVQVLSLSPSLHLHALAAGHAIALARDTNDAIIEMIDTHPTRFRGFGFLPLQSPQAAVAELERLMAYPGILGVMVATHVDGTDWDHPTLGPILAAAESSRALVFVHPVAVRAADLLGRHHLRNLIGNPLETTIAIASLIFGGVLDRYPELKIAFAHGGGYACWGAGRLDQGHRVRPEAAAAALPSAYLRRLFFDSLTHDEMALRILIDRVGIERVMLGSDDPADMAQEDPVGWIDRCSSLTASERRAILGGNVLRLVGDRLPG